MSIFVPVALGFIVGLVIGMLVVVLGPLGLSKSDRIK